MTYTKQTLRRAVFAVFEDHCNLDNYEFVALLDRFENYRKVKEIPGVISLRTERRIQLTGALEFLRDAQHITTEQCDALVKLAEGIE